MGDEESPGFDEREHLPEEERDEQRPDVAPVDVGVAHDDDPLVANLVEIEVFADPGTDRCDERLDLGVGEDLVEGSPFDVQHLAAQRQNRLGLGITGIARRTTGRVALDDEQFGSLGIAL